MTAATVSARQICDETGIDLELFQAIQRALGMPTADDPDAAILLRADSEAAARAKVFIDMGLSREQVIAVTRVLGHGLAADSGGHAPSRPRGRHPTRRH